MPKELGILFQETDVFWDFQHYIEEIINKKSQWDDSSEYTFFLQKSRFIPHKTSIETIPISSVEFFCEFVRFHYNIDVKPISLLDIVGVDLKRKVYVGKKDDIPNGWFFKEHDVFKTDHLGDMDSLIRIITPDDREYMISENIDFSAEFRVFVYKKKIIDIRRYSGKWTEIPDFGYIEESISNMNLFYDCGYAIDFGINSHNNETYLIEAHPYFSCGHYGFNDEIALDMLISTFNTLIDNNGMSIQV